ncbi:ankyrin repeat-containing domain protein [Aspergillus pseudoustus]|uniref:Ankyrin repeat-containing domain protein n=1 Tax=Aspergillus pseudoustus TaxID=1810923 RepID=A0ABR4KGY1_9EURO
MDQTEPGGEDAFFDELWQCVLEAFGLLDKVYCVVDELNSDQADFFLRRLVELGQMRPQAVKLRLEDRQTNKDIALFIEYRLRLAADISDDTTETIKKSIEDRVHPSFLYARLMLNGVLAKRKKETVDRAAVQDALLSLPPSMEAMYSQMLHGHSQAAGVPQERQLLILQLATHASRPLRLLEIATVLDFVNPTEDTAQYGNTKNMTRMSCGPLLVILEEETVSIIHHSFTEFLTDAGRREHGESFPVIDDQKTQEFMTLICVKYLPSGPLFSWEFVEPESYDEEGGAPTDIYKKRDAITQRKVLQLQYPFLAYALHNWYYHARRLTELSGEVRATLKLFMKADNQAFLAWIDATQRHHVSPLYIAAWTGMTSALTMFITPGQDLNDWIGTGQTPLITAAREGHADTVARLLKLGASPDESDDMGCKPLHYAARRDLPVTVQVLMDAGVSPLTPMTKKRMRPSHLDDKSLASGTLLRDASRNGCVESVHSMLLHLTEHDCKCSLRAAVNYKRPGLVKYLVDTAGIDVKSDFGGDLLLNAAWNLDLEIMELSGPLRFFLPCAAAHPRNKYLPPETIDKAFDLALGSGCDINARGVNGQAALHHCMSKGLPVVEKLLERGADAHANDDDGSTPLHLYKFSEQTIPALKVLLKYGATWGAVRVTDGLTPVHTCLSRLDRNSEVESVFPFVTHWDIPDRNGNSVFHSIVLQSAMDWSAARLKVLMDFLKRFGIDVNSPNYKGQTLPLVKGSEAEDIGNAFLAAGADIGARNYKGRTWWLRAIQKEGDRMGPEDIQSMLHLSANANVIYDAGNNALHLICRGRSPS